MAARDRILSLPLQTDHFRNVYISPGSLRNIPKEEHKNPEIEKLRAKVFNPELDELIQKVSQKKKEIESIREKSLDLFSDIDQTGLHYLSQVFSSRNKKLSLTKYLSHHLGKLGLYSFMLSNYNCMDGLYYPELYYGLSPVTGEVLYFHSTGKYLREMENNFTLLPFDEKLATDTFFRKKIDNTDFENFSGMYVHRFEKESLVGLLIIFYKITDYNVPENIENLKKYLDEILAPIFPTINLFFLEQYNSRLGQHYDFYIYRKILQHAKAPILRGDRISAYIYKITIENFFNVDNRYNLKASTIDSMSEILEKGEMLIEGSCNELFYITGINKMERITDCLGSGSLKKFNFLISSSKYPDDDKNFYLHF